MAGKLGILAGGGELPARLAETCQQDNRPHFVVALEGHAQPAGFPPGTPLASFRMGAAGAILARLKAEGVTDIVMAGPVRRPSLAELRPDWKAAQFFARIGAKALGDDGLLRGVVSVLEEEGFRVVGVQELVADLLTPLEQLSATGPDATAVADIAHGVRVARAIGELDVGQSVVVQQGLVLGVEAIEGTDALIARCAGLKRQGPGPVLVKVRKPQQDQRLDMPTIGPVTVRQAAAAGFAGIAAEAGNTLLLGRDEVRRLADSMGLFVVGVAGDAGDPKP
ncbi:LpxI family protein [Aerophototrophica crusticola]|uniref:LpxI family protein n=1 Tax=Aerophototrophica crusticola TaxID=1709002 RepID=A0A858R5S3_9PROT|nr:LpxI family protein [Rhodospirillaceae bacterium B3]